MIEASATRPSPFRWLAVPALLGVLVLVGMAISTESRDAFQNRTDTGSGQQDTEQAQPGDGMEDQAGTGQAGDEPSQQPGQDPDRDPTGQDSQNGQDSDQGPGQGDQTGDQDDGQRSSGREQTTPVVIQTPGGDVVVQLGDGDTVTAVAGTVPVDPSRTLRPDGNGDFSAIRVTEDGTLEPIDQAALPERDFALGTGADGGLEVTRPDGSTITLTPTADGGVATVESSGTASTVPTDEDAVIQPSNRFPTGHRTAPTAEPLIVESGTGPVRMQLNPDGDLVADQPDQGTTVEVNADDLVAIRLADDGTLEVVPLDQVEEDDTVLVPADGGIDLVRPDGSRVEFRADGENDGVTATEVGPDGTETELTPNPDGSVTLSDGTTVGPIDFAEDGNAIERLLDQTADLPWTLVFGAIALLVVLSAAVAAYLYRTKTSIDVDLSQLGLAPIDPKEMDEFVTTLSADPDPARAIRLAFYAAERGLGGLPPRRPDETPFEWHNRVEQVRPDLAEPLGPICDRFAMVRFAPGHATSEDRDAVVARLRQLNLLADGVRDNRSDTLAGV